MNRKSIARKIDFVDSVMQSHFNDYETHRALHEAIKLIEQEPCEDCIRKQDEIRKAYDRGIKNGLIEPKTGWIPCIERMPDEREWLGTTRFGTTKSDEVYVTFENQKGERFTRHLSFQNGKLSISDQHTIDAFYKGSVPIAWMPLPEPYKESEG